jgi:hypothetical protein
VGITLSMLTRGWRASSTARARSRTGARRHRRARESRYRRGPQVHRARTRYINSAIALSTTSRVPHALVVTMLFASAFTPLNIGRLDRGHLRGVADLPVVVFPDVPLRSAHRDALAAHRRNDRTLMIARPASRLLSRRRRLPTARAIAKAADHAQVMDAAQPRTGAGRIPEHLVPELAPAA